MRIKRNFTEAGRSPYQTIDFESRLSEIRGPDGKPIFSMEAVEVPKAWSQVATDIIAQKYFRKAGVPAALQAVPEDDVPDWLWQHQPDREVLDGLPESTRYSHEISSRQVFDRMAGTWTYWGWKGVPGLRRFGIHRRGGQRRR